jgi:hypothetical protein
MRLEPLISHTGILMTFSINNSRFVEFLPLIYPQEIRIIATGPCITNQLRNVNTICRRSWYIAAHIWKIYDFKIEVVPFIINFSELTTVVKCYEKIRLIRSLKKFIFWYQDLIEIYCVSAETMLIDAFSHSENVYCCTYLENLWFQNWSRPVYHKF